MSFYSLVGKWGYVAGSAGTPTIPKGAQILSIAVHATSAGSFTINGGSAIPVPAGETLVLQFRHLSIISPSSQNPLVFTSTDSYFVEYSEPQVAAAASFG